MFEKHRILDADVGTVDDHAVDVPAEASVRDREAELFAIALVRAQIETGQTQPADGHLLETMAGLEYAQHAAGEIGAVVDRHLHQLVAEPAHARFTDARGAEIIARRHRLPVRPGARSQERVDELADRPALRMSGHTQIPSRY